MRFSYVSPLDAADAVTRAGADYLDVPMQGVLHGETPDEAWSGPAKASLPLPLEAGAGMLPAHLCVVGPERDEAALKQYVQRLAQRGAQLGMHVLVFGSGPARHCGDATDRQRAWEQIIAFVRMAGDVLGEHGIALAVEHLTREETDMINGLDELAALLDEADHPNVGALIDAYHLALEDQPIDRVAELGERIRHVHVAERAGRWQPGASGLEGEPFDFARFFRALHAAGYDGRVSIEGRVSEPFEASLETSLRFLREQAAAARGQA